MPHAAEEKEIELFDYLKVVFKYKYFIVIFSLFSGLVGFYLQKTNTLPPVEQSSISVALSFSGIQNWEYPNETLFARNDLINPRYWREEAKKQGLPDVKLNPFVRDIIPEFILKEEAEQQKKGTAVPFKYFPNEFLIILQAPAGRDISSYAREAILESMMNEFKADFQGKFVEKSLVPPLEADLLGNENYEYFSIVSFIEERVNLALSRIGELKNDKVSYYSSGLQGSINEIKQNLNLFLNYDLSLIKGYIEANQVYKNIDNARNYLKCKIREKTILHDKKKAEYDVAINLMEKVGKMRPSHVPAMSAQLYNKKISELTKSAEPEDIVPRKKAGEMSLEEFLNIPDYYPALVKQALEAGVLSETLSEEVKFLEKTMAEIKPGYLKTTKDMESNTKTWLQSLTNKANELLEKLNGISLEFDRRSMRDGIQTSPPRSYKIYPESSDYKLTPTICGAIGLMISLFFCFFYDYIKTHIYMEKEGKNKDN